MQEFKRNYRRFQHNGIVYDFKWAKRKDVITKMPVDIGNRLEEFFLKIFQNKIPHNLFNDQRVMRCSSFRIKKLKRGAQPVLSKELIEKKLVEKYERKNQEKDVSVYDQWLLKS